MKREFADPLHLFVEHYQMENRDTMNLLLNPCGLRSALFILKLIFKVKIISSLVCGVG